MLRANTGSWKWDPARQKFALPASKHTELSGH